MSRQARQSLHLSVSLQGVSATLCTYTASHAGVPGPRRRQLGWWELYLQTTVVERGTMKGHEKICLAFADLTFTVAVIHKILSAGKYTLRQIEVIFLFLCFDLYINLLINRHLLYDADR